MALAVFAALLAVGSVASPLPEVLSADDDCKDGVCALNALQTQRWEVDGAGVAAPRTPKQLAPQFEALLQAMAKGGVKEEHLEGPRAMLAKLGADELSAVRSNATCSTWTGGTCLAGKCAASRGAAQCSNFACVCVQGFCAQGGACSFDFSSALGAWGGGGTSGWSMPAPAPSWGSWSAPAPSPGWGSWGAPAPAPAWGSWGGSSNSWANTDWSKTAASYSGGGGSSTGRFTGGTCLTTGCSASRGATDCGLTTGYQCLCKENFKAVNGVCVWR